MKKIVVSNECVACGSCTLESNLLIELPNGKVVGKEGIELSGREEKDILEVSKLCPVGAISIVEDNLVKANGKVGLIELIDLIHNENKNLKNKLINKNDYTFNKNEYKVPISNGTGGYRYEYKSDDKAMKAGLNDFDKVMYSQRKALIQQVLVEFKHRKLKKYYKYEEKEGNYYYDTNRKIRGILERFIQEAERLNNKKISIPKEMLNFNVKPDVQIEGFCSYILGVIEDTNFTQSIMNELESLSWYDSWIDTDDMEDYRGKYMYCYKDTYKVCELFAGHILDEVAYVVNGYDGVEKIIKETVDSYWNKVEKQVTQTINILIKNIKNIQGSYGIYEFDKGEYDKEDYNQESYDKNGAKYNLSYQKYIIKDGCKMEITKLEEALRLQREDKTACPIFPSIRKNIEADWDETLTILINATNEPEDIKKVISSVIWNRLSNNKGSDIFMEEISNKTFKATIQNVKDFITEVGEDKINKLPDYIKEYFYDTIGKSLTQIINSKVIGVNSADIVKRSINAGLDDSTINQITGIDILEIEKIRKNN